MLNRVFEVREGKSIAPALAGPVVYWLDDSKPLRSDVGEMVEVTGKVRGTGKSEADVQRQPDGSLIVELEGPGDDVETTLIKLDVEQVRRFSGSCQ